MNLNQLFEIIALNYDGPLPPALAATHYDSATLKLFMQLNEAKDWEGLRGFKKTNDALLFTNGTTPVPADYFVWQSAYHMVDHEPKLINIVEDAAFDKLLTHSIEFPTEEFSILNVQSNYIRIAPKSVRYISFTYLVRPEPVVYAVTDTHGFMEFDEANSSPVLWNEENVVFIIQEILNQLGVPLDAKDIKTKK